ncbi:MAG: FtsH protease activity modulator HflK [Acidobacteria bacterium]|nr:MAG: FtsH protease activity modulator HflK [Acidobacteriota bacterium]
MKEAVINISRLTQLRVPRPSRQQAQRALIVLAVILLAWGMFYQVGPDEAGLVQRFGRFVRTGGPGLRVKLPAVETVTKIPVQRQLRQQFGFRSDSNGARLSGDYSVESTMLTGDLNVVVVEWIVQYRIADPYAYLFKVRDADRLFSDMTEAVMRQAVGDRTVTEVVTVGRPDIEATVQQQLQAMVDQYQMGLRVQQVVLQDVNPPPPVKPSWDQVNQAQQQRDRLINEARTEYNKVIPLARGQAEQAILSADAYALDRVNRASGDAARFDEQQAAYRKAPEITRRRLYLETMNRVLPRVGGKVIIDKDAKSVVPLLPLDRLTQALAARKAGGK